MVQNRPAGGGSSLLAKARLNQERILQVAVRPRKLSLHKVACQRQNCTGVERGFRRSDSTEPTRPGGYIGFLTLRRTHDVACDRRRYKKTRVTQLTWLIPAASSDRRANGVPGSGTHPSDLLKAMLEGSRRLYPPKCALDPRLGISDSCTSVGAWIFYMFGAGTATSCVYMYARSCMFQRAGLAKFDVGLRYSGRASVNRPRVEPHF